MSPATVVAMAKAQGIALSESLVRKVRGPEGGKPTVSAARKTPAVKTVAKKTSAASKAPASKPAPISKSDFIREQPASMSVADVIAKAKAQGMNIGRSLVYMVRERSTAKSDGSNKAPAKKTAATPKQTMTSKTIASKTTAPHKESAAPQSPPAKVATMSKADFVRQNRTLSAKEVVKKGQTVGMKLSENYVYRVRGYDKLAAKRKAAAAKKPYSKPTVSPVVGKPAADTAPAITNPAATTRTTDAQVEDLLRAIAAELGLGRAVEILAGERAKVRAVIGGE